MKTGCILALFLSGALVSACGGSANSNEASNAARAANSRNEAANATKTNIEELGLLINMPYEAEEVVWKDDPQHKKLVAILRFSPEDSKKLVAEAEKVKAPDKITLPTQIWFPPELIAQGDLGGEDMVNGRSYPANQFFQPPYTEGRITHVEDTDYFVLEVTAK
ncbi:MAG: hypothetical protein ABI999_03600 [Acidobacteriota bacterium]